MSYHPSCLFMYTYHSLLTVLQYCLLTDFIHPHTHTLCECKDVLYLNQNLIWAKCGGACMWYWLLKRLRWENTWMQGFGNSQVTTTAKQKQQQKQNLIKRKTSSAKLKGLISFFCLPPWSSVAHHSSLIWPRAGKALEDTQQASVINMEGAELSECTCQ